MTRSSSLLLSPRRSPHSQILSFQRRLRPSRAARRPCPAASPLPPQQTHRCLGPLRLWDIVEDEGPTEDSVLWTSSILDQLDLLLGPTGLRTGIFPSTLWSEHQDLVLHWKRPHGPSCPVLDSNVNKSDVGGQPSRAWWCRGSFLGSSLPFVDLQWQPRVPVDGAGVLPDLLYRPPSPPPS